MAGRDQFRAELNNHLKEKGQGPLSVEQVQGFFDTIVGMIGKGEKVQIQKFGTFVRKTQDPRMGRNPATGDALFVPGKVKMGFQLAAPELTPTKEEAAAFKKKEAAVKKKK